MHVYKCMGRVQLEFRVQISEVKTKPTRSHKLSSSCGSSRPFGEIIRNTCDPKNHWTLLWRDWTLHSRGLDSKPSPLRVLDS